MKKLKTILQSRYLFKILAILACFSSITITNFYPFQSKYQPNETTFVGKIISYKIDGDKLSITLKAKEKLMVNYYFSNETEKKKYEDTLKLGDIIEVKGTLKIPSNNTVPNQFNYKKYLSIHKIYYLVTASKINKQSNNTSISYYFKNKVKERLNQIDKTGYIRTFITGDKSFLDSDMVATYQENGINHLFAISGMHISFITSILLFFLEKITYNNYYKYSIIVPILLFYLFLADYSASIVRTVVVFILSGINQCFNLKIKKIDLILLTLFIICIINPFILYDIGFQFSYTISLSLIIFSKKSKKMKNKIQKNLYTSYVCFLVSLPICLRNFYQVNILSCFLNLFMIPFVSIIVFPFSLVVFIFPKLNSPYHIMINILEKINIYANKIKLLNLCFFKPSILLVVILYIFIFLTLIKPKYIVLLITILIICKIYPYIDSNTYITTIDVDQGDSIFIKLPNQQGSILIDTGGKINIPKESWQQRKKELSYTESRIIPYIKSLGMKKINYLILSHGDYDHMGEAITLVNSFKVDKVIFNCGEFNNLEKELIKVLDKKRIKYYSCIKELNIDKNKFYFLQTKEYDNENDNSNVIYTKLNNYKFLFMGDASSTTEKEILSKYNLPNIDILKVGHHGSKTSSSEEFIREIKPKYSVISVGKNNRYGHPNKEVLNNLDDSKIYRTDQDGSIIFKIKNNQLKIETCSP